MIIIELSARYIQFLLIRLENDFDNVGPTKGTYNNKIIKVYNKLAERGSFPLWKDRNN